MIAKIRDFILKRAKIFVITVGALIAVTAGSFIGVEATSTNAFCSSCHEMQPAYESYLKSSHYNPEEGKRATCRDCHVPPWSNPPAVLWSKTFHGIKDIYKHFADSEVLDDPGYHVVMRGHAAEGIADASCLQCHRDIFSKDYGELVNIHASVKNIRGSKCAYCHQNLVHWPYPLK